MAPNFYLSVDIGRSNTRVWLFDDAYDAYSLRASAQSPSTVGERTDVRLGFIAAVEKIQDETGINLLDPRKHLLIDSEGRIGVRGAGLSLSAGEPIRTTLIGVSENYSLAALRRLVSLFHTKVVMEINLQDDLNDTAQLENLISSQSELFVIGGGFDEGASKRIRAAIENIRVVYHNLPGLAQPQIVYAGNRSLAEYAERELEAGPDLHLAGNIQPLEEQEDLQVGWKAMLAAFARVREGQIPGLVELQKQLGQRVIPTTFATTRTTRIMNSMNTNGKGVLTLDVGAGGVDVIVVQDGLVMGGRHQTSLTTRDIQHTQAVIGMGLDKEWLATALYNKQAHPGILPATLQDIALEQAWARVRIQNALNSVAEVFPTLDYDPSVGLRRDFEPIVLSGACLTGMPTERQVFLTGLDSILPHGITTFVLDKEQLMPALGSLASVEPLVAIQVIDSGIFINLGTAVSVISPGKIGDQVISVEVDEGESPREHYTLTKGEIKRIELLPQTPAHIYLSPASDSDVGMGLVGLGGWLSVSTGKVGVVIDARGRPLSLPEDDAARSEKINDWLWELGG